MKLTGLIDALIAAGGTMEQVRAVVAAAEEAQHQHAAEQARIDEERRVALREDARLRQQKSRKDRASRVSQPVTRDICDDGDMDPAKVALTHEGTPAGQITTKTTDLELNKTPPTEGQKPAKAKLDRKTRIASDAQPADKDRDLVGQFGLDAPTFRHEWAKFRSYHASRGTTMTNWSEGWRKWLLDWVDKGRKPVNGNHARAGPPDKPVHRNGYFANLARSRSNDPSDNHAGQQPSDAEQPDYGPRGSLLAFQARSAG